MEHPTKRKSQRVMSLETLSFQVTGQFPVYIGFDVRQTDELRLCYVPEGSCFNINRQLHTVYFYKA